MDISGSKAAVEAQLASLRTRLEQLMLLEVEAEAKAIEATEERLARIGDAAETTAEAIEEMAGDGRLVGEGCAEGALKRMADLRELAEKLGEDIGLLARKDIAKQTEGIEKRLARLMRVASQMEAISGRTHRKAEALGKSKRVQDHMELILGAVDELPIDAAMQLIEQATARTSARAAAAKGDA